MTMEAKSNGKIFGIGAMSISGHVHIVSVGEDRVPVYGMRGESHGKGQRMPCG